MKRHGLLVDACLNETSGHAGRVAVLHMIEPRADCPHAITFGANGHAEIAFGALKAGLDLGYSQNFVHFTWAGFDEMDGVSGDGYAELLEDDAFAIVFAYYNGDKALLKAKKETSATVCLTANSVVLLIQLSGTLTLALDGMAQVVPRDAATMDP